MGLLVHHSAVSGSGELLANLAVLLVHHLVVSGSGRLLANHPAVSGSC